MLSSEIKDVVFMWSKVQKFVEKNHLGKVISTRICILFNDNALLSFRKILMLEETQHFKQFF